MESSERQDQSANNVPQKDASGKVAAVIIAVIATAVTMLVILLVAMVGMNREGGQGEAVQTLAGTLTEEITLEATEDEEEQLCAQNYAHGISLIENGEYAQALFVFESIADYKDSAEQITLCRKGLLGERLQEANIGDMIAFGAYEQDNDLLNGSEQIQWRVLDKRENRILVVSRYALDCQLYHISKEAVTWEDCTIRKWLNTYFLQTAFTQWEQEMIPTVTVYGDDNYMYGTVGGAPTKDQVFLLSMDEVQYYFYSEGDRLCLPTTYAIANGAWTSEIGFCYWWLRSPGETQAHASAVFATRGSIHVEGNYVNNPENAVRPAMWIELESE